VPTKGDIKWQDEGEGETVQMTRTYSSQLLKSANMNLDLEGLELGHLIDSTHFLNFGRRDSNFTNYESNSNTRHPPTIG